LAGEQLAKGCVCVAIHAFVGEEAAKGVPAAVIRQGLRNRTVPVVDVVGLLRAEGLFCIRGDALTPYSYAVVMPSVVSVSTS